MIRIGENVLVLLNLVEWRKEDSGGHSSVGVGGVGWDCGNWERQCKD